MAEIIAGSGTIQKQVIGVATYATIVRLNPMRGRAEEGREFGPFQSPEAAWAWVNAQRVEPYIDEASSAFFGGSHKYNKTFARGSILEWFNPPPENFDRTFGHGIYEKMLEFRVTGVVNDVPAAGGARG